MSTATRNKPVSLRQSINGAEVAARVWSVDSAYKYCERIARSHYENFPVGSALVPKPLRKHFHSIYAFARTADDFADEGYDGAYSQEERTGLLNEWRQMLEESAAGRATHPIFVALAATRARFDLPFSLFEDLLSAFRQDVVTRRYESFDELLDYCRRSANPVGRLVLLLFGYRDERLHQWSDSICTALQLTNHWQGARLLPPRQTSLRFGERKAWA
jgi:hydroxysqualene synthase